MTSPRSPVWQGRAGPQLHAHLIQSVGEGMLELDHLGSKGSREV